MAVILLVEDEEQVRVLAQSYLEEQGHQVLSELHRMARWLSCKGQITLIYFSRI